MYGFWKILLIVYYYRMVFGVNFKRDSYIIIHTANYSIVKKLTRQYVFYIIQFLICAQRRYYLLYTFLKIDVNRAIGIIIMWWRKIYCNVFNIMCTNNIRLMKSICDVHVFTLSIIYIHIILCTSWPDLYLSDYMILLPNWSCPRICYVQSKIYYIYLQCV